MPSRFIPQPDFVGRSAELVWLERSLQEAMAGRPQLLLVLGEAGVGKTRLQGEICERARRAHVRVGIGCSDENMPMPYGLLAEALKPHLGALGDPYSGVVACTQQLLGCHDPGAPGQSAGGGTLDEAEQARAFHAVEEVVVGLASELPLLLCLDDLHWSDRPSFDLLLRLVHAVGGRTVARPIPLMLLCGSRPVAADHRLATPLERLQREPVCTVIELGGLHPGEVGDLLETLGDEQPSARLVEAVHRLTLGNPLFVREVFRHLAARGNLGAAAERRLAAGGELDLPPSLLAAIATRTRQLALETRRLLTLAACIGERFSVAKLVAATGQKETVLLDRLEEAVREGMITFDGDDFAFGHPLLRRACHQEASGLERRRLHLQIARAFERQAKEEEASAMEIASHLIRAGSLADSAVLRRYARCAGDQAFAAYASGDAARFYEAVLAALDPGTSPSEAAELHCLAGSGYYREANAAGALEHFERAAECFAEADDVVGVARAELERMRVRITLEPLPYGASVDAELLEKALSSLPPSEEALRGRILSLLAGVHWTARDSDRAGASARQALKIAHRTHDWRLASEAWAALSSAETQDLKLADALLSNQRAIESARAAGDSWLEAMALSRIPLVHAWLGDLEAVEHSSRDCDRVNRLTHDWAGRSLALAGRVVAAVARGDFEAVEECGAETLRMAERSRYPWGALSALPAMACARVRRGDARGAEAALARLDEPGYLFPDPGPMIQLLVWVYRNRIQVRPDLPHGQRESLVATLASVSTGEITEVAALGGFGAAVEIAEVLEQPKLVRAPRTVLARAAARGARLSSGWVFLLPRLLGVAAALERDWSAAERHLDDAIELAGRMKARAELALSCFDAARMRELRQAPGDEAQARELASRARELAVELGMHPLVHRASELGSEPPLRGTDTAEEPPITGHWLRSFLALAESGESSIAIAGARAYRRLPTEAVIMMTDIVESTRLIEELGDTGALAVMRRHNVIVRRCMADQQGTEIQHTGDGLFGLFLSAARALACAVDIQRSLARENEAGYEAQIRVRIGLSAGRVLHEEGRLFGAPVVAAARLCAAAKGDQILVSEAVRALAGSSPRSRDLGRVRFAGFKDPLHVHEVLW